MTNVTLFNEMIREYNELSFTHNYIWGFVYNHNVYAVATDETVISSVCKLDKASRGAGYALRFCPTIDQKTFLMGCGATIICSEKFFNECVADSKYNRGEIFEKMITEKSGQRWIKDTVKFTDDGDLTYKGVAYQIKFEKATFTNEKTLSRLYR